MATTQSTRFPVSTLPDCTPRSPCHPAPVCPACGGLECLCRPRFFAGQLLTEDDLNRLDDYIVKKNRLHNRYLVGWGVACGLEVVCDACDPTGKGSVIVRSGYALSPCGNDIVVCGDTKVDVCNLIARCRPSDDMCLAAPAANAKDPCGGGTEEWILGICYAEKPSRGITPLLTATDPAGCSCGGHSGCGCGGAKSSTSGKRGPAGGCSCGCGSRTKKRPAVPTGECEPTLTCEGYAFAVWKAPAPVKNGRAWGAAATRFICCVEPFLTALGQYPAQASGSQLTSWYFNLRDAIRDFLVKEGLYDCEVAAKLAAATLPDVSQTDAQKLQQSVLEATYSVLAVGVLVVQKCLCAALLPPCPAPADADCVPIATLTVRRRPCEVLSICNIGARKFLVTIPAIEYWLSFFSAFQSTGAGGFDSLRALLERLCCTDVARRFLDYTRAAGNVFQTNAASAPSDATSSSGAAVETTISPLAEMISDALAQPGREVDVGTLMLGAMGGVDPNGRPLVSDAELGSPTEFLLANQVLAPALRALLPAFAPAVGAAGPFAARAGAPAADLTRDVAALKKTVAQQQRAIEQLRKRK